MQLTKGAKGDRSMVGGDGEASVDEKVKGFRCVCASRTAGTGAASSTALLAVATATYMTLY